MFAECYRGRIYALAQKRFRLFLILDHVLQPSLLRLRQRQLDGPRKRHPSVLFPFIIDLQFACFDFRSINKRKLLADFPIASFTRKAVIEYIQMRQNDGRRTRPLIASWVYFGGLFGSATSTVHSLCSAFQ